MKVLIIEDHPIFIRGLKDLLNAIDPLVMVHTAERVDKAMAAIEGHIYDLILLDLNIPGLDGISFMRMMKKKHNHTPITVVSSCDEEKLIFQVIHEGALGFIPKSYSPEAMTAAIKSILTGEIYLPEALQRKMSAATETHSDTLSLQAQRCQHLGIRQKPLQVLKFLSAGYTNKEIARELNISIHTVKAHLGTLSTKLQTSNRLDTVMEAKRLGLL